MTLHLNNIDCISTTEYVSPGGGMCGTWYMSRFVLHTQVKSRVMIRVDVLVTANISKLVIQHYAAGEHS